MKGGITVELPSGFRLLELEEASSTNTLAINAARAGEPEGLVICASRQTAGRGRRGREFYSPQGTGLYMSILLRPKLSPECAVLLTAAAAVAVCNALEKDIGVSPSIKWVNDIILNGKKVCGILTESSVSPDCSSLDYAIVGIGLNISSPPKGFPPELRDIAGAVTDTANPELRDRLACSIVSYFDLLYRSLDCGVPGYAERVTPPGAKIKVISASEIRDATVLGTDDKCRLIVRFDSGEIDALSSGEISIRI